MDERSNLPDQFRLADKVFNARWEEDGAVLDEVILRGIRYIFLPVDDDIPDDFPLVIPSQAKACPFLHRIVECLKNAAIGQGRRNERFGGGWRGPDIVRRWL